MINLPDGESAAAPQVTVRVCGSGKSGVFCAEMTVFTCLDCSAKLGARNDVPHEPLIVRSSMGIQLNATLGLLVPPTSLYWS